MFSPTDPISGYFRFGLLGIVQHILVHVSQIVIHVVEMGCGVLHGLKGVLRYLVFHCFIDCNHGCMHCITERWAVYIHEGILNDKCFSLNKGRRKAELTCCLINWHLERNKQQGFIYLDFIEHVLYIENIKRALFTN